MDEHLRATPAPEVPPTPLDRKTLRDEVWIVLAVSVLASAVFAAIDLFSAPIRGQVRATFPSYPLIKQLASLAFQLAPVALVVHLVARDGGGADDLGLRRERPLRALGTGAAFAAVVGALGLAGYLIGVQLGASRVVVPIPPPGNWWTIPVIALGALAAGLLEEVVVVGYLITRLQQLRWSATAAIAASALLRGSYHLYQGWGAFLGNAAMGALFGWWFVRTRRLWPLVIAHTLIDLAAGVGYLFLASRVSWI